MNYKNKDWLHEQYITLKKSTIQIANEIKCNSNIIWVWLVKFKIPRRIGNFQKGQKSWSKGLTKEDHPSLKRASEKKKGENHPYWQGENASASVKRTWIRRNKEKPSECEICSKEGRVCLSFDHSLGEHTRNIEDYKWLCYSCHMRRDHGSEFSKNITDMSYRTLHKYIEKNKRRQKYCTICNEEKKLELACIDHIYTKNLDDYIYLCKSCHNIFDMCRAFIPIQYKQIVESIKEENDL